MGLVDAIEPDSPHAAIYTEIARRVWDGLRSHAQPAAPRIVIE